VIECIIAEITQHVPISRGVDFLGFNMDCDVYCEHERFENSIVNVTNDPQNMLEIIIEMDENFPLIQELSRVTSN